MKDYLLSLGGFRQGEGETMVKFYICIALLLNSISHNLNV